MKEDIQKTALRLPRDLHTAILETAKDSSRTMNAEIVHRLQQSFTNQSLDIPDNLLDQILTHKGGKPLDLETADPDDIAQALVWVGEVQRSLITRMLNATKSKIDGQT